MAVTLQQIAALNDAIGKGVRSVTIGDQTVIYNTTESLIKARNDLQAQYNRENSTARRPRQIQLYQNGQGF